MNITDAPAFIVSIVVAVIGLIFLLQPGISRVGGLLCVVVGVYFFFQAVSFSGSVS